MPSTGTPICNMAGSECGAPSSNTELGQPERMIPLGFILRNSSTGVLKGTRTLWTWCSRTRRAISCEYCAPKSKMTMPEPVAMLSKHGKASDSNAALGDGNECTLRQVLSAVVQDLLQKPGQFGPPQSFDANSYHGWLRCIRKRQSSVKIRIQSNDDKSLPERIFQYSCVVRRGQADFTGMHCINSDCTKVSCGGTGQTLIEQEHLLGKGQRQHFVVERCGCKRERLANVLVFQFGIFAAEFFAIWIQCQGLQNAAHRQTQVANAGLTVHSCRIAGDSVELHHCRPPHFLHLNILADGNSLNRPGTGQERN